MDPELINRVYFATRAVEGISTPVLADAVMSSPKPPRATGEITATIQSLLCELAAGRSPGYDAKQLHPVPPAPLVVREDLILNRCNGKRVLDVGASGLMHAAIEHAASKCHGIDRDSGPNVVGFDLDRVGVPLPQFDVDLVVCGEVLEHLSNPGHFLDRLKAKYPVETIFSVPNAFSDIARQWMAHGTENVNLDHCFWFSWRTLKTLLNRSGYEIKELYWYKGRPLFAEGLIVVA